MFRRRIVVVVVVVVVVEDGLGEHAPNVSDFPRSHKVQGKDHT
jgi:hypothetical protein